MGDIDNAIKQVCEEKGLSYESVIATIESALAAAYRKDFGQKNQNIKVEFNPEISKSKVFDVKTVVEDLPEIDEEGDLVVKEVEEETGAGKERGDVKKEGEKKDKPPIVPTGAEAIADGSIDIGAVVDEPSSDEVSEDEEERRFNPKTKIQLSDAKLIKKTAKIGQEIKTRLEVPEEYGRMAAQTAKQVIVQRLREAEREMIFSEFKDKEKEVVSGVVQRREGRAVLIDLGKAVGILFQEEQIPNEDYRPGERIKVYVQGVSLKSKGPEIILSRTSEEILKKVFYLEIPEISNGLIELKAVAREAGSRSKVAVWTDSDNVDPIGSCVGQRGARIQTIINELGGEKVDIIQYDEDPVKFIANSLSPAKILSIDIDKDRRKATVTVSDDQLSLAIGKGGQNARLAAKLTGWKIDIAGKSPSAPSTDVGRATEGKEEGEEKGEKADKKEQKEKKVQEGKKEDEKEGIKKEKKVKTKKSAKAKKKNEDMEKKKSKEDEKKEEQKEKKGKSKKKKDESEE